MRNASKAAGLSLWAGKTYDSIHSASPSLKKVSSYRSSLTLSPHHWWKFSCHISGSATVLLLNEIIVCISSSPKTSGLLGVPTRLPAEEHGKGPPHWLSYSGISGCMSITARLRERCAGEIDSSCAV